MITKFIHGNRKTINYNPDSGYPLKASAHYILWFISTILQYYMEYNSLK